MCCGVFIVLMDCVCISVYLFYLYISIFSCVLLCLRLNETRRTRVKYDIVSVKKTFLSPSVRHKR